MGGETRCKDAEGELMKGPLTEQETVNDITRGAWGLPHPGRGAEHRAYSQLYRAGLSIQSTG